MTAIAYSSTPSPTMRFTCLIGMGLSPAGTPAPNGSRGTWPTKSWVSISPDSIPRKTEPRVYRSSRFAQRPRRAVSSARAGASARMALDFGPISSSTRCVMQTATHSGSRKSPETLRPGATRRRRYADPRNNSVCWSRALLTMRYICSTRPAAFRAGTPALNGSRAIRSMR